METKEHTCVMKLLNYIINNISENEYPQLIKNKQKLIESLIELLNKDKDRFYKCCIFLNAKHLIGYFCKNYIRNVEIDISNLIKEPKEIYDNKYVDISIINKIIEEEILLYNILIDKLISTDEDIKSLDVELRRVYNLNRKIKKIEYDGKEWDMISLAKLCYQNIDSDLDKRFKKYYELEYNLAKSL